MNGDSLARGVRRWSLAGLVAWSLLVPAMSPITANAAGAIASSSFVGAENPLSEGGAWAHMMSFSPTGSVFQKNNGAFPTKTDHAAARTTTPVPNDQYSEIVVGHVGIRNNIGPIVRVQASGAALDSHYLWWASIANTQAVNNLYRMDANGTGYTSYRIMATSPVVDGDRLRLIARGQVIYGIKNGVRDFIYNAGRDTTKYLTGTTGIFAWTGNGVVEDSKIASWSTDAAPTSSGTWASTNFAGVEDPLDEGDRWYPLPGYGGFKKAGAAIGVDPGNHEVAGVWSINAPAKQYSEVTLGAVASGGGGPVVRIDRTNNGQTGWLLFLYQNSPWISGIYKLTPDGGFTAVQTFTPTIVSGDKWRLTADGNTLTVSRNGASQFTYVTDGSYAAGDVGMDTYTSGFTFVGWEGGAVTSTPDTTPPTAPSNLTATAASSSQVSLGWAASTDDVGVTGYRVERCQGSGCATFTEIGTVAGTSYSDTGLSATTSYSYRVRATDAAANPSGYSNVASATTPAPAGDTTPPTAPSNAAATASGSSQIGLSWTTSTDNVGVTGYFVERCQGAGCNTFGQIASVSGSSYADTGLSAGTSYSYRVRATDAAGNLSAYSNVASATTQAPPTITSFSPTSGPVGSSVAISGTSFNGATAVTFNGVSASFAVTSDSAVQATVPAGATTGPISVTTPQGTATSGTSFTVTVPTAGLLASKAGNGKGTIASTSNPANPDQINCGVACSSASATYPVGTVVTLTASPAIGSNFTRWDGCDSVSGTTCSVTLTANRSVTATFTLQTFTLTVTKSSSLGVGDGTVTSTSNPSSANQIDCGSRCAVSFDYGTVVTLTATPNLLAFFDSWTGCDTVSGNTCTVTVNSARTVRANFLP